MQLPVRIIGFLSLAGAAWSSFAGTAHFDALLLSGAFLLGSSVIAEVHRRSKASSATLEIRARLAALGAEHDGLAAQMKTFEAYVNQAIEKRAQERIDDPVSVTRATRVPDANTPGAKDNVVPLFADPKHGKPR